MSTTTTERPLVGPRPAPAAPPVDPAEAAVAETAGEQGTAPGGRGLMYPVAGLAVGAGLAAAGVGFALSYGALVTAAAAWGFGDGWQAHVFPLGVDGLIIALYCSALVLAWKGMARPWVTVAAHAVTVVTIVLNMAAAAGSAPGSPGLVDALREHPARLLAHAAMPIAYVLLVEVARWAITRTVDLKTGAAYDDRLSLADWLLRFPTTWAVYRHAKTWPSTYADARTHVRELAIYRVWLKHREEIEAGLDAGRVGVLDRLPELLARHGVSVEEARAIPDRMREQERKRTEDRDRADRERARREAQQRREAEHGERLAVLADEEEQTRRASELEILRARTAGATRAAAAEAEAEADTAAIRAGAARTAAERTATEEQRAAEAEAEAEETARTTALRRKAAEDEAAAKRAEAATATAKQTTAEAALHIATTEAAKQRRAADAARYEKEAADDAAEAARLRETAAAINARAAAMEEEEGLNDRARKVRRVARLILMEAGGNHLAVPLRRIEDLCRVKESTAGEYRAEAADLIKAGYTLPQT